jgi:carboxyl-terminal processing protease
MKLRFEHSPSVGRMIFLCICLVLAASGGVILDRGVLATFVPLSNIPDQYQPDFKLMAEAWNAIHGEYVDREAIQPRKLTYGAIAGMVDALGDTGHSTFLTPEMLKTERNFAAGEFQGIGAQVRMKDGRVVIVAPFDGSPAQKAGLRPGEIILQVDGTDTAGLPLDRVVGRITGKPGTSVTLTILNPDSGTSRQVTVVRAVVHIRNVTWQLLPGTTVIDLRIAGFSLGTTKDLRNALKEIVQDKKITGIILDLRNNPGGILREAIGTASQFVRSGPVVLEKNSKGEIKPIPAEPGGLATEIPLVVLINGGSASASEIVAGAIDDEHRATLVGEKTFGTGTVLRDFALSDGSALLLAVDEWLTPKGRVIWHNGIIPEFSVSLQADIIPLTPDSLTKMTEDQLKNSGDAQLLRALDLLGTPGAGTIVRSK